MIFWKAPTLLALLGSTIVCASAQHLEETGRHRVTLTYDYTAYGSGGSSSRFYLPVPPTTGCQTITAFHSSWPGTVESGGDSPSRRVLSGSVPGHGRLHWRVQVTGTFTTHELVDGPPTSLPVSAPSGGEFLGTSESIDWKSDSFQQWLEARNLRRTAGETSVAYGHRLYNYLTGHGRYSYPPSGGWVASGAARRLRTDCGGFSLVFVAACRANHIPARLLVGQWFKTREGSDGSLEEIGRQAHVIAEFFDPHIGWIPEDIASHLMGVGGVDNYFGREPGYFFAWHLDTDFHFDVPGGADGHVQWIQNPTPWFSGGGADDASCHWSFSDAR